MIYSLRPLFFIFLFVISASCIKDTTPLEELIRSDAELHSVASDPDHEVQIIYTRVDRDSSDQPILTTYTYNLDSERYFYPASTVKFPAVLLALEKMKELGIPSGSQMQTDSSWSGQSPVEVDSTAPDLSPSVAHYSKKILLVSDNDAFNRLYEFIGQDEFNSRLREKEYTDTRILHRLSIALTPEQNARTNALRFYDGEKLLYEQDMKTGSFDTVNLIPVKRGVGYMSEGTLINEPFDFTRKNFFPLDEQHRMMQAFIFPSLFPGQSFDLTPEDRELVLRYSSMTPASSEIKIYQDTTYYWDTYVKFLMYGSEPDSKIPRNIRIFNKIGLAYGYAIDNAYITDEENGVEFFLSAVIHTNANRIFNDNNYEYDEIAFPFLEKLGQEIYQMELNRSIKPSPNLTR